MHDFKIPKRRKKGGARAGADHRSQRKALVTGAIIVGVISRGPRRQVFVAGVISPSRALRESHRLKKTCEPPIYLPVSGWAKDRDPVDHALILSCCCGAMIHRLYGKAGTQTLRRKGRPSESVTKLFE